MIGLIRLIPAALKLIPRAFGAVGNFAKGSPSRLGIAAVSAASVAAPIGMKAIEHESGGALSEKAYDASVRYLKDKIEEGVSLQDIEEKMDSLDYIVAVNGAFNKSAQNLYVRQIMQQNPGPEAVAKGKIAAVQFQLLPDNVMMLGAKQAIRTAVADDMFADRDEADRYLANGLINDIVEKAQVRSLDGNQVGREDVKAVLADILRNPEKHPHASRYFSDQGRLVNGLKQEWPEIFAAAPAQQTQPVLPGQAGAGNNSGTKSLSDRFNEAVENNGLNLFSSLSMFLAVVLSFFGMGSLADHFKRAVVAETTISQYNDRFGLTSQPQNGPQAGVGARPAPEMPDPETNRPQLVPAPAP